MLTQEYSIRGFRTRCHKILGPPCDWGPAGPILPVGWGPRRELGAPHTFLTDSSVRLRDGRSVSVSVSVCQCLSMSSAVKQVPKMPNHQCIMEETEKESRFTNCDIFAYMSKMESIQLTTLRTRNVLCESEPSFS